MFHLNIRKNNSFSLQQISKTGNLDSNLIIRHYKLNLMIKFMQIKFENPQLKQFEIVNRLVYSSSILQRYRNDIKLLSPYSIHPINTNKRTKKASNTNIDNSSHRGEELERPQMTSNGFVKPDTNKRNKNILKGGSTHENIENNDEYLDEILR